ncbi:MAG TPA: M48 family metalloprotease [Candidatus Dormibacteraeota bacterium]|nr:M48 family metalloprotease [Candidatus Dormibacteraeota bacterium]
MPHLWVVIQSIVLTAPEPVQLALLAHEVAHIARGHLAVRRRLKYGAVAAIGLIYIGFIGAAILEIATRNTWLWLFTVAATVIGMLTPRAIQLAVFRWQEYERTGWPWSCSGAPSLCCWIGSP